MNRLRVSLSVAVLLAMATTVAAQDAGRIGFVANTAESLGVVWGLSERVAVRAGVDFNHVSSETELPEAFPSFAPDLDNSFSSVGVTVSALVSLGQWDDLKAYVAPGYGHSWRTTAAEFEQSNHRFDGMFGLQYALGSRFRVFGEAGIRFSHSRIEQQLFGVLGGPAIDLGELEYAVTTNGFGSASRVGVIFYFK